MRNKLKSILFLVLLVVTAMYVTSVIAASGKIAGTMHDFSVNGTAFQYSAPAGSLDNQVCAYCHTPHNAGQNKLLWNKAGNGNSTFKLYTSSSTLSNAAKLSSLSPNSPSLFCLTCHDGKTAINVLHTGGGPTTAASAGLTGYPTGSTFAYGNAPIYLVNPYNFGLPEVGPNLGGSTGVDLTNDHPIGFSYTDAFSEKGAASLKDISLVDIRVRAKLFGTTNKVECTTCHDPHVNGDDLPLQVPFLVMENSASSLCLTCHNK